MSLFNSFSDLKKHIDEVYAIESRDQVFDDMVNMITDKSEFEIKEIINFEIERIGKLKKAQSVTRSRRGSNLIFGFLMIIFAVLSLFSLGSWLFPATLFIEEGRTLASLKDTDMILISIFVSPVAMLIMRLFWSLADSFGDHPKFYQGYNLSYEIKRNLKRDITDPLLNHFVKSLLITYAPSMFFLFLYYIG